MDGIPISINIAVIVLFALAGFLEARRLLAKNTGLKLEEVLKRARYLYVLIPLVLVPISANMLIKYRLGLFWHMPLWLQYIFMALNWGVVLAIFSFLFALALVVSIYTHHPERWKILIAALLLIIVVQTAQFLYTRPIAPQLGSLVTKDGVVLQTSGVSCAAASGANIARIFGLDKTEKEMAELYGTSIGTSAAQVIYGMRKLGFICTMRDIKDANPEMLHPPAMIFIDHPETGPESHAVVYAGFTGGKAEIWDPLIGKRFLPKSKLANIWHGRGIEFQLGKRE